MPRSGENRLIALIRPTVATCTRSSSGSPRLANRRAMCWATGRYPARAGRAALPDGVVRDRARRTARAGERGGRIPDRPCSLARVAGELVQPDADGRAVAGAIGGVVHRGRRRPASAAPASRTSRWTRRRRRGRPAPRRAPRCVRRAPEPAAQLGRRRGDVDERGARLVDRHPQVGDRVEVEVGARREIGGDRPDGRDQRRGGRRPDLTTAAHPGVTAAIGSPIGTPSDSSRWATTSHGHLPTPLGGSISGGECGGPIGVEIEQLVRTGDLYRSTYGAGVETSRSRRSPAWCAARISTASPLEARNVTALRSTTSTSDDSASSVVSARSSAPAVIVSISPSTTTNACRASGCSKVTPSSPGPRCGPRLGGLEQRRSPPTGQLKRSGAGAVVAAPERAAVFSTSATLSGRPRCARARSATTRPQGDHRAACPASPSRAAASEVAHYAWLDVRGRTRWVGRGRRRGQRRAPAAGRPPTAPAAVLMIDVAAPAGRLRQPRRDRADRRTRCACRSTSTPGATPRASTDLGGRRMSETDSPLSLVAGGRAGGGEPVAVHDAARRGSTATRQQREASRGQAALGHRVPAGRGTASG